MPDAGQPIQTNRCRPIHKYNHFLSSTTDALGKFPDYGGNTPFQPEKTMLRSFARKGALRFFAAHPNTKGQYARLLSTHGQDFKYSYLFALQSRPFLLAAIVCEPSNSFVFGILDRAGFSDESRTPGKFDLSRG